MLVSGSIVEEFATCVGLLAGAMAVGGFLSHAGPALSNASDGELRRATARGGLVGLGVGAFVVVLSAIFDRLIS
jgi:hypothetical protein